MHIDNHFNYPIKYCYYYCYYYYYYYYYYLHFSLCKVLRSCAFLSVRLGYVVVRLMIAVSETRSSSSEYGRDRKDT